MKDFLTAVTVLFLFTFIFYAANSISSELSGNANLEAESLIFVNNFSNQLSNTVSNSSFSLTVSSVPDNQTSTAGVESFELEFVERNKQTEETVGPIQVFKKIPDLIKFTLGVEEDSTAIYWGLIAVLITLLIFIIGFRSLFGGGRLTEN